MTYHAQKVNGISYCFQYQIMKKIRLEKSSSNSQALNQKRSSLTQECIATAKPEWRGPSPNVENSNSKVFFQSMKAELSNIKNDFEKLIRKEISLKPHQDPLKLVNSNKQKQYCSAKKDQRSNSGFQKYESNYHHKETEDSFARILNLEKNLPCSSEHKQIISKTLQLREERPTTSVFDAFDTKPTHVSCRETQLQKDQNQERVVINQEAAVLKQAVKHLQAEIAKQRQSVTKLSEEVKVLSDEKIQLIVHVSDLNKELSTKKEQILENQRDIQEMRSAIKILEEEKQGIFNGEMNWHNQRQYLTHQLDQLSFHHDELRLVHQQALGENEHLRDQIEGMQRYCDDLQARCANIQSDYKRKLQYLQKDIQSYQKREDMFSSEIQRLNRQISAQTPCEQENISQSEAGLHITIANLKDQIEHITRQLQIQKDLHIQLAQRYEGQAADTNNTTDLIKAFEEKNNELVEENGKLKTKINYIQSSLQSLNEQNKSYLQQIRLYEERQKKSLERKQLNPTEWEQMTEEIERLRQNNQQLIEELEFKQAEKDNGAYQSPIAEDLLRLTQQQIEELQASRQELKLQKQTNANLLRELQLLRMSNLRSPVAASSQLQSLQLCARRREQQIRSLKEVIFGVIVKKAGKREYQDDVEHILRQVQALRNNWI